jgi:basic membrane protein A
VVKKALTAILILALLPIVVNPAIAAASKVKIGIIYDVGGRGDGSINDATALGVAKAKKKFGLSDLDVRELVTSGTAFDRENRIEFLVKANYYLIIGVGTSFNDPMTFMSEKYPESQFAIIGSAGVESLNVSCMYFRGEESAYLAGVMAALNSKSKKIGYLGDSENSSNALLSRNFTAGAKHAVSKIQVINTSSGATANAEIKALGSQGVDVLFSTWSRNGTIISAITNSKKSMKLIGVEPEQYYLSSKAAKKVLIGYVNQRFDLAVSDLFAAAVSGQSITDIVDSKNGVFGRNYSLANNGVELSTTAANQISIRAVSTAKAAILAKKIVALK